jgi:hypothetical protein
MGLLFVSVVACFTPPSSLPCHRRPGSRLRSHRQTLESGRPPDRSPGRHRPVAGHRHARRRPARPPTPRPSGNPRYPAPQKCLPSRSSLDPQQAQNRLTARHFTTSKARVAPEDQLLTEGSGPKWRNRPLAGGVLRGKRQELYSWIVGSSDFSGARVESGWRVGPGEVGRGPSGSGATKLPTEGPQRWLSLRRAAWCLVDEPVVVIRDEHSLAASRTGVHQERSAALGWRR